MKAEEIKAADIVAVTHDHGDHLGDVLAQRQRGIDEGDEEPVLLAGTQHRLRADHAGLSRVLREIDSQQELLRTDPDSAQPMLAEAVRYLLQVRRVAPEHVDYFLHPQFDLADKRAARDAGRLLAEGLNVSGGKIRNLPVAEALGLPYFPLAA